MSQLVLVVLVIFGALSFLINLFYKKFIKKKVTCEGCAFSKNVSQVKNE
jgi:hypothetical protein